MWKICIRNLLVVISLALLAPEAHAWLRASYEDAVIVQRSELIVIGYIKKDSIKYIPHDHKPNEGASWEHHATLVITEVIKGQLEEKEISIIIHYGIDPLVGGVLPSTGESYYYGKSNKIPADQIDLFDQGGNLSMYPFFLHAEKDNLWFLRKRSGTYGREPGKGNYGIADPQDVQPLELKDYFKAYLEKDPEAAVKACVASKPALAPRVQRYFDHLEVQRILAIQNVEMRAKQLVPYFLKWQYWSDGGCEAEAGLVACGEVAGPLLLEPFNDPAFANRREDIMHLWGQIRYKDAIDLLIGLLRKHDQFWAEQNLQDGNWWNSNVDSDINKKRRNISGEVHYAVIALRQIGDARAKEAIEMTAKRWRAMKFSSSQIVEECDAALKQWALQK